MPRRSLPLQLCSGQALSEAERARHDITPLAKETSIPIVTLTEGQSPLCHFERAVGESRNLASQHSFIYNRCMIGSKTYYVYIMTNQSRTLYVGITNNIRRRVWQYRTRLVEGFTHRYKINTLVYVESFGDALNAIEREKQIKHWRRDKKLQLISKSNPEWHDLSDGL